MMLDGRSRKDPGAPVLKKVSLPGGDGKHAFIPITTTSSQGMVVIPGQQQGKVTNGSPKLVMVGGPAPNMSTAQFKGQPILVPAGNQPIFLSSDKLPVTSNIPKTTRSTVMMPAGQIQKVVHPSSIISTPNQTNPVILVQSPQGSSQGGRPQQILIPPTKGQKGGQIMMVPVTATGAGQPNLQVLPSNYQSKTAPKPQIITQQGLRPGVSLVPVNMQATQKGTLSAPRIVRIPPPVVSGQKTVTPGANGPFVLHSTKDGNMKFKLPSGTTANGKAVFIPDSALGSLPKGVKLFPIPGIMPQGPKNQLQFTNSNFGALQGGKVVLVQNPKVHQNQNQPQIKLGTTSKNIVVVGGPGGKTIHSTENSNTKQTIIKTIHPGAPQIIYRNRGASHLPSMLNKPIKPKPVIETSDTFFKTPIEIKPLEEEKDDDLDDVLNALQGGGHVDLVPVNENTESQPAEPADPGPSTPQVEDFGLKIDSVYSLTNESEIASWNVNASEKQSTEKAGDSKEAATSKENQKDTSKDSETNKKEDSSKETPAELPAIPKEPLLPEKEPSQSGQPTSEQSKTPTIKETDKEIVDPNKEDVGNRKEEDPNLMRGDCLQVRLAQQAARQLQEQMRQESERLSLVQAEWDEDRPKGADNIEENRRQSSEKEQTEKNSEEEDMEVERQSKENPEPSGNDSKNDNTIADDVEMREPDADDNTVRKRGKEDKTNDASSSKVPEKNSKSQDNVEKTENTDDVAQKALLAATLNGCEVADEDLNDMFDELISEYLTTPERPKPSVRVRGIDECKTFMEDSPQSLVTTTQESSLQALNTSVLPRTIPQLDNKMKPRQLKTAAGTITLIPVKVPVQGKPGETAIKYIPMKLPSGAEDKSKHSMPQFVKIVPSTSTSKASPPTVNLAGTSVASAPKIVKIVSSGSAMNTAAGTSTTVTTASGKSLIRMVIAPSSSVPTKPTTSTSVSGLSNADMAKAILGATRNVFGQLPVPPKGNVGTLPKTIFSSKPSSIEKVPVSTGAADSLALRQPQSTEIKDNETLLPETSGNEIPLKKKKKKKKKKLKLPKTKKCSVLLRKLNMKVIKNSSVNLKRVKKAWIFEAIPRQPRREAKRKAVEMEQSAEPPAAKRAKNEKGEAVPKANVTTETENSTLPSMVTLSTSCSETTAPAGGQIQSLLKSPSASNAPVANIPTTSITSGNSALYRIMSQLPQIRPAMSGDPRPTPAQILKTPLKLQQILSTANVNTSVVSVQSKTAAGNQTSPISAATLGNTSMSSSLTLKLSCTTAAQSSITNLSSQSVCTNSKASTILTATCSAPVLSPSVAGKITMMNPPNKSLLPGTRVIQKSPEMPRMPTLLPAGVRMVSQNPKIIRMAMPTLQPAPRSLLSPGQNIRSPGPLPVLNKSPEPAARQKPPTVNEAPENRTPIVIQPTDSTNPPVTIQPAASAGASSQIGAPNAGPNKKYLLIKTSAGQFLVPVPVSKAGGGSGAAGPTGINSILSSIIGQPRQQPVNMTGAIRVAPPAVSSVNTSGITSNATITTQAGNSKVGESQNSKIMSPIRIKDEPKDTGYNKYEKPSADGPTDVIIKEEEKASDDEGSDRAQVAATVCHKQRIEELKARLREHEEQLLQLKKKREDTKKILESLDTEQSE